MNSIPGESEIGLLIQEKTDACDQRYQKCHKITNFFPLLKSDGKSIPMNTSQNTPSAAASVLSGLGDLPSKEKSPVADGVHVADEECMGILKAPISHILRSKMGPSKKDSPLKSSLSQTADNTKAISINAAETDSGPQNMDDNDSDEGVQGHSGIDDALEENDYVSQESKPNMDSNLVNPELKREIQSVFKARKGGSSYSAKTFASTSASSIVKSGKGSSDTNLQCELPDLSSQPSQFNQDHQQSVSPSQNCASSSGSASSNHPEVRSGSNAAQSFLPASIIEIPSQNAITKKHRRRHFKGGTYNLYLSPYRRKKNKKKSSDTASSVKDDESSIAGTENGSVIDSEGDNSIYSEDYYSPSEKSLLGDEPASPGRVDCCSGLEMQKNKEANDSQTFLTKENCKSFDNIDGHSKVDSGDTASCGSLSSTLLKLKDISLPGMQSPSDLDQDMCDAPAIKIKTEPPDRPQSEFVKCKKIRRSLSSEECDQLDKRQKCESPKNCEPDDIEAIVKQQISKYVTDDIGPNSNTPIRVENNPEIIKLLPLSSSPETELRPPSVPAIAELPSGGPSDTELPSSVPQRELSSESAYPHSVASGATNDNAVSTIAKSVKSRQRIKRRFTDDIVDTDAGILSLNCMSGLKRAKDQPSVSPRSEMKIGQGSRVECVVDMKLPPVASCTCEGNSLKPKSKADNYIVYCQAVDSFYENRLGCSNPVTDVRLVRPSVKNPFVFMCRMHLWRLKSHHSCPVCGLFCSEGTFLSCQGDTGTSSQVHYFHEDCMNATVDTRTCLHCGNSSNIKSKYLEFHSPVPPGFSHKQCITRTKARMSIGVCRETKENPDPKRSYVIPETGKVLSGVGLTKGSDQRIQFEEYLSNLASEKAVSPKYSILDMHSAAASGDVAKVLYMMAMGFDPNYRFPNQENETALHAAAATGHLLIIHLLIQAGALPDPSNDRLYTPLMLAVENQHQDIIEYLITAGSHLLPRGDDGMTCLHLAAKAGNLEMVKTILNARMLNINMQDEGGWTALVWATEHKHIEIVKLLVGRGADPNITDNEGNIGLHWSAFSGSMDICRIFLDHGCDVNAVNEHGDTPLHIAARQGYYECIHVLLIRRGNPFVVNKAGKTPLDCCAKQDSDVGMALHVNMTLKKVMSKFTHRAERVVHPDISKGKEENPIQCVNAVDDEEAPFDYYYVLENCETSPISFDRTTTTLVSCSCVKDCYTNKCNCGNISFRCWYDKDGCLVSEFNFLDPPLIFECNRTCTCWWTCGNRVIQNGIVCRLQLFRTQGKGWGVRTLKDIPKGAFICEYVGELITDSEADRRAEDSYLFDLDYKDGDTFCLDAHFYGNISRFINHLCEPNIVPVKFFIDHQDLRYPRIAFFSSREIKACEELGFDYGEKFWSIKYKSFTCHCNAPRCKYSKDTINETLANYNRRIKEEAG